MESIAWLSVLLVLIHGSSAQRPQVTLPGLGTMEGYFGNSFINDRSFNHFRGVPFAQPPINELRFQAPQPVQPWSGILDAHSNFGHRCPQIGLAGYDWQTEAENLAFGSSRADNETGEDCLYLQVFSPNLDPSANLPVIVFLHGGAFSTGSSRLYGGNKFMDHDVVLVIPHYRLGPLGFFSLHTDEIPGNAGMLDQVEALRWVQNYITYFGGDPNKVTVMGESAGGASTSLLNLSPLSANLFQQYICQSGTGQATWVIDTDPVRAVQEIGTLAGCPSTETAALTECLKTIDYQLLNEAQRVFAAEEFKAGRIGFSGSTPVVQRAGAVRFLERPPTEIYESGDFIGKPTIFGANKHEGTLVHAFIYSGYLVPNDLVSNTEYMKRGITRTLLNYFGIRDQGDALAIAVEDTYLGRQNMGDFAAMTPGVLDYLGNMFIKGPTYDLAEFNAAKGSPTYFYSFHYHGSRSLFPLFSPNSPIPGGVAHGDELILQFSIPTFTTNDQDKIISNQILNLWVNFATYGNPTPASNPVEGIPTWPAWTADDGSYLLINITSSIARDYTQNDYFVSINENFPYSWS